MYSWHGARRNMKNLRNYEQNISAGSDVFLTLEPASSKKRPAANTAAANTAGPETAEIGLGRRPRELPWLVTPAPSANQAVTTSNVAAAAGADGRSGADARRGSSRSGSTESTAGSGCGGRQKQQQPRGRGRHAELPGSGGCSEPGDASLSPSGRNWDKSTNGRLQKRWQKEEQDDRASEASAATASDAEWARRQRCQALALACAGSMDLPVGTSSSADSGGGGGAGGGTAMALPVGLGPGSIGDDSPSSGGRGAGGGANGRGGLRRGQGMVVVFADRLSAVLESNSAVPLEELQAGLLELRPFRFGIPFSSSTSSSSLSSSASSTSSSSSALSVLEDGDAGGDGGPGSGRGGTWVDATGDSRQRASKPAGGDPVAKKGAARRAGRSQKKRTGLGEEKVPVSAQRRGGPTTSPAARASARAGAPPPAGGSRVDFSSAGRHRHPVGREKPRSNPTTANKNNGWVRSRSFSRGGARRGRSGTQTTPHTAAGCWVPPPTRWGGTPIKSPLFLGGGEGSTAAHMGGGKEGDGCVDTGHDRRSRGLPLDFHNGGELEWVGGEEGMDAEGRGFEIIDAEFFRTVDGQSLFAESLSGTGGKTERVCHAIQWGEDGDRDDQGHHRRRGFFCLLGEEGHLASERGSPDGRRLGVAARRRRARIDTKSRDGKRRAEMMFARETIKRLEEEVIKYSQALKNPTTPADNPCGRLSFHSPEALEKSRQHPRHTVLAVCPTSLLPPSLPSIPQCISRRTDKLKGRANLAKSRGEASAAEDRERTLLGIVALVCTAVDIKQLLERTKKRRAADRDCLLLVSSALRVQRAWREYRRPPPVVDTDGDAGFIRSIMRISTKYIIRKRARVLALLKLWPEGEAAIKLELRTGKRIRGEGSWRATCLRRSSRTESTSAMVPHGSVSGGGGGGGGGAVTGSYSGGGGVPAAGAAAANILPAPWFPRLVKQMEIRKNETAQNLMRGQEKVKGVADAPAPVGRAPGRSGTPLVCFQRLFLRPFFRHTTEAAWISNNPIGQAYKHGNHQQHLRQQQQLQHHAGDSDEGRRLARSDSDSTGGGSVASVRTNATDSTAGAAAAAAARKTFDDPADSTGRNPHRSQQEQSRRKHSHSAEHSDDNDTQEGSLSSSVGSLGDAGTKKNKRRSRGSGGHGDGGRGGQRTSRNNDAKNGLGAIFDDDDDGGGGEGKTRATGGPQFSRTTPAASSSGQGTRVFSATGSMHHRQPRNKNTVAARDMTSLQLLGGGGWLARLAEMDKEIDAASLVPLPVKLSTIESFMRAEILRRVKLTSRDQASRRTLPEQATVATAKALLHGSIEDFFNQAEAALCSKNIDMLQFSPFASSPSAVLVQLYSGEARLRFMAEVDKRVRGYMEKGSRRSPAALHAHASVKYEL
ncbi:unnamed protein product [Ectocarpus sp. CCAP 1310/34]|nr:unnamed protein product [Ectocarpus sp. CCAP 1310/34]